MNKILLIIVLALSSNIFAQQQYGIVASGGIFEFGVTTFQDRASIGVINMETKEYTKMDQIEVESVQEVELSDQFDGTIFLAAQDSIISYYFNIEEFEFERINEISFSGIKTIEVTPDYLIAGKWYGTGDFLVVYDHDLNELFASPSISTTVEDILVMNDTLAAVSYNLKGTIDGCAPYGCFADSVGRVDVIDLNAMETIETIDLGTIGIGKITLAQGLYGDHGIIAVSEENELISYINDEYQIIKDTVNSGVTEVVSGNTMYNFGAIYAVTKDSLQSWSFNPDNLEFGLNNSTELKTKAVWHNGDVTQLGTDFATYGRVYFNYLSDSVEVEVSPEDIEFGYFGALGLSSKFESEDNQSSYYSSKVADLELSDLEIYSTVGVRVLQVEKSADFDDQDLVSGVYFLKAIKENEPISFRILKR